MRRRQVALDEPLDGSMESVQVREIEQQLANQDVRWLTSEHVKLLNEQRSPRGIKRRNWLRLQAVSYLLRANTIAQTLSLSQSPAVQLWLWPNMRKDEVLRCVTWTTLRRAIRAKKERRWAPSKQQLSLFQFS